MRSTLFFRAVGIGDLRQPLLFALESSAQRVPRLAGIVPVDVAERDDVVAEREVEQVDLAHAADADAGDVQPIARRRLAAAEDMPRDDGEASAGECHGPDEVSSGRHGISFRVSGCAEPVCSRCSTDAT